MIPARLASLGAALLLLPTLAVAQPVITWLTWTGNATTYSSGSAQANASNAANWLDNTAPTSSGTTTGLEFGASAGRNSYDYLDIELPGSFAVAGLRFNGPVPNYFFSIKEWGTLDLGAAGITINTSYSDDFVKLGYGTLNLLADQTWDTGSGNLYVHTGITDGEAGRALTKTGSGLLTLDSPDSEFSGGFVLQQGALHLGASSTREGSSIQGGPVGTGTLTLNSGTKIANNIYYDDVVLHNPLNLGNNVVFGEYWNENRLTFAGNVTPLQAETTIRIASNGPVFFTGSIADAAAGATRLTIVTEDDHTAISGSDIYGFAVLGGTNTYTGGTWANGAGVIFFNSSALPTTGGLSATNGGYIGAAFPGGGALIISKIADKPAFNGAIGLETDPDYSVPNTFNDTLNLADFTNDSGSATSGFWGIGTMTRATLSASSSITPPTGGNYVFGGGDGTLFVETPLAGNTGVRVRSTTDLDPITVWLRGDNSFTGNLYSDHSIVILDSPNALPGSTKFQMDSRAYVGFTEATGWTTNQFLARLNTTSTPTDSVLGFDATSSSRTVSGSVDLTPFTAVGFIGTTSHVTFDSSSVIKAAGATKILRATGVSGGWLKIDGQLASTNVLKVVAGATGNDKLENGIVELTNAANNFPDGTTLQTGFLLVGTSSTFSSGNVTQGPLGTGPLTLDSYSYSQSSGVVASAPSVTIHNPVTLASYGIAQFGVEQSDDSEDLATSIQDFKTNGLTLAGPLSGSPQYLRFAGPATFTLGGANPGLNPSYLQIGNSEDVSSTRLIAVQDNSLGTTSSTLHLAGGADLSFSSTHPAIGTILGGNTSYLDTNNQSYLTLANGATLTINQQIDGELWANIVGAPGVDGFSSRPGSENPTTASTASLVKDGSGLLSLHGANNLSGGLVVNAGAVYFATTASTNVGPITLNGGGIGTAAGIILSNSLTFGELGGMIGGTGTFSNPIAVGENVILTPGASPGTINFTAGLTFDSNGEYIFEIQSASSGTGYLTDLAAITGALNITATVDHPFTISLRSLDGAGDHNPLDHWDASLSHSWTLATTTTGIIGFSASKLHLDTSGFMSSLAGGSFALLQSGDNLVLNFTPVPEPSTYALLGTGLALVGWQLRRRRRT